MCSGDKDDGGLAAHLARVDSKTVVLVLHVGIADGDVGTLANVEGVSVVAAVLVTVRVIDGNAVKNQVVGLHAKSLDGGVLDIQAGDGRVNHGMGVEELGLSLAAVSSLGVPPAGAAAVDDMAFFAGNFDVRTGEADQGTLPLLVSEGSLTLEDDLYSSL